MKMKKEILVKDLSRVDVPEIIIVAHKEKLKYALLDLKRHEKPDSQVSAGSISAIFRDLCNYWRQPSWRTAVAGLMIMIVMASVTAVSYFVLSPSPAVIAADIVRKDYGVQQSLGGSGEILILQVELNNGNAKVVCGRGAGDFIEADVDMSRKDVVATRRFEGIYLSELPLVSQDRAIKIAWENDEVKSLVSNGATFGKVFPVFTSISSATIMDNNMVKITPASSVAIVPVRVDQKMWLVQVNLDEGRIESIIEPQIFIKPDYVFASKEHSI